MGSGMAAMAASGGYRRRENISSNINNGS